jgi:hypothetical protein
LLAQQHRHLSRQPELRGAVRLLAGGRSFRSVEFRRVHVEDHHIGVAGVGGAGHLRVERDGALIDQVQQVGLVVHEREMDDLLAISPLHGEGAQPGGEVRRRILLEK